MRSFFAFVTVTLALIGLAVGLAISYAPERDAPDALRGLNPGGVEPPPFLDGHPALKPIRVVSDPQASFEERFEALHEIVLAPDEPEVEQRQVQSLVAVLQDRDAHSTLRNDVVLVLASEGVPRPGIGAQLVAMWRDGHEDPVWRDYCLQHLETVFDLDPDHQNVMRQALMEASDPDRKLRVPVPDKRDGISGDGETLPPPTKPEADIGTMALNPPEGVKTTPTNPPAIIDRSPRITRPMRPLTPGKDDSGLKVSSNIIVADGQYRPEVEAVLDDNPRENPRAVEPHDLPDASAATALLAMERLGKRHPDFRTDALRVARKALERLREQPDYAVAALQVLARGDDALALAKARAVAMDPGCPERLRMSALWVIGAKGDSTSDLGMLRQAAVDKDFRIASAGKAGVEHWSQRNDTAPIR